ncbi:hypothetical protein E2C01_014284 [Portunus trituberculatus]|uniref:Uncharacterized protein n=1 Tax=Portunus trituberculatus TaxID=210409 RepID=A0A5B7DID6_PORTR|nr:hypothetical protein [Portunus trituberculatus]
MVKHHRGDRPCAVPTVPGWWTAGTRTAYGHFAELHFSLNSTQAHSTIMSRWTGAQATTHKVLTYIFVVCIVELDPLIKTNVISAGQS